MEASGFKVVHQESRSGLFEYGEPVAELWDALTSLKKRFFTDLVTYPFSLFATSPYIKHHYSLPSHPPPPNSLFLHFQ